MARSLLYSQPRGFNYSRTLVTNYFCHFSTPRELHSDHGRDFESRLLHEIFVPRSEQNTHHVPYTPSWMVWWSATSIWWKNTCGRSSHHTKETWMRDYPFLLAYWASTRDTMGFTPARLMFGRELPTTLRPAIWGTPRQGTSHNRSRGRFSGPPTHYIHNYARQHLKLASDWKKTRYDKLANSTGYQEGDRVWIYCPTHTKGKSPKRQTSWEGPYKIVTQINDVVYRIHKNLRLKMMLVHLGRLAPHQGATRDKCT
jgi:hypothetical protein